jgi:hypothetical protein
MAKYEEWQTPESLNLIKSWARDGLTNDQIASNMGISKTTFHEWRKKFPNFADAVKNGKDIADAQVENALYNAAILGEAWAVCFWLKNRKPDKYRDKPDADANSNLTIIIKDDYGDGGE